MKRLILIGFGVVLISGVSGLKGMVWAADKYPVKPIILVEGR